jgi:hypothetical protein
MGLDKDIQLSELYDLKHRHDSKSNRHYPWEDDLLKKSTTPYIWKNPNMNSFVSRIEKMSVLMLEQVNFARNFFNYTVPKYYNDHWG